jgi:phenylpyruvate tautomerase PptA (4-oxalocrotonate tautomerase family)
MGHPILRRDPDVGHPAGWGCFGSIGFCEESYWEEYKLIERSRDALDCSSSSGDVMPLFTVTMRSGRAADEKSAISRAIHQASIRVGYPKDDMFQRFFCLEQDDLKVDLNYPGLPHPRTEKMLMIEVLVSSGTDAARKARLLAALVEMLDGAGTDPNDIMVFFGEIDRANSSFGGGRLAPPVAAV